MIPDVTPNGVFYLPPTGWLTSFYNPPFIFLHKNLLLCSKTYHYLHSYFSPILPLRKNIWAR
ncbi:hypothetical protein DN444_10155 [Lactobacillus reuteri]|nr:hypothetical protein [Limosilactobacillus reuteri]